MRLAYADPPYIGCAHLYRDHPDYAGEVDHAALIDRLESEFDGWVLHASATPTSIATLAPLVAKTDARWCSWVKGFAAFKRNVPVAYAWEPVIIKPARKPSPKHGGLGRGNSRYRRPQNDYAHDHAERSAGIGCVVRAASRLHRGCSARAYRFNQ
jgi:hypothetical protein